MVERVMDEAMETLMSKIGDFVRGQSTAPDLYAWLASRDPEIQSPPAQWGQTWLLLHEHFNGEVAEEGLRVQFARMLSPRFEVEGTTSPETLAVSQFQATPVVRSPISVQLRLAGAF